MLPQMAVFHLLLWLSNIPFNTCKVGKAKGVKYMVMEEDLTLGGKHTMQYTDDVS